MKSFFFQSHCFLCRFSCFLFRLQSIATPHFFFIIALLREKSQAFQCTHVKHTAWCPCTGLCTCDHNTLQDMLLHQEESLDASSHCLPTLGTHWPQAATNLLSVSTRWALLDPTARGPLWLASFKERHSFMVQPPAHCVFLKRFQRQDTCVYRHTFEHGWLSCICLCSHCREWQCCVLGDTHTHTHTHTHTYSYP